MWKSVPCTVSSSISTPFRQQSFSTSSEVSKTKQIKQSDYDPKIYKYIINNKLGRVRLPSNVPRRLRGSPGEIIMKTQERTYIDDIFEKKLRFTGAAAIKESFPLPTLPEVAFLGRSNVGKSSLINSLTKSTIVRTSMKPGTTRTINWFNVSSKLYLVDLPGYGFAYAKDQDKERWQQLTRDYLSERTTLTRIMLLLDARHGLKQSDLSTLKVLESATSKFQIVFTKVDLVEPVHLAKIVTLTQQEITKFKNCSPNVLMVSARTLAGISNLRREIGSFTNIRPKPIPENTEDKVPPNHRPNK